MKLNSLPKNEDVSSDSLRPKSVTQKNNFNSLPNELDVAGILTKLKENGLAKNKSNESVKGVFAIILILKIFKLCFYVSRIFRNRNTNFFFLKLCYF